MTTSKSSEAISVIGLGAMGSALADAFLNAGHPTTVWNRTPGKAGELIKKGARPAASVEEAISAGTIVFICVLDYQVVQEILYPVSASLTGRVLVNLTNGTPQQAREVAAWGGSHGIEYLDGGIMATPSMIGHSDAIILYSGSQSAFHIRQEVLGRLGTCQYLGTDPGLAALYDLSLLSAMYSMFSGILHAIALVGTEHIGAREFSPMLVSWLHAMIQGLPNLAEQIDTGQYDVGVESNLSMQAAAVANILQGSHDQGVATDLIAPLKALMDQRIADGYGAEDFSGLIELIRQPIKNHFHKK